MKARIFKKIIAELRSTRKFGLGGDKYIAMRYRRPWNRLTKHYFLTRKRMRFWTLVAKRHPSFRVLYGDRLIDQQVIDDCTLLAQLKKNGYVMIEDALSSETHQNIKTIAAELKEKAKSLGGTRLLQIPVLDKVIQEEMNRCIGGLTEDVYNRKVLIDSLSIRIEYSDHGLETRPIHSYWHADRFVPSLAILYFPEGSDEWCRHERVNGVPTIGAEEISIYLEQAVGPTRPEIEGWDRFVEGRDVVGISAEENTLMVMYNHVLHRRAPMNGPGCRSIVFAYFYNNYGKWKVLYDTLRFMSRRQTVLRNLHS